MKTGNLLIVDDEVLIQKGLKLTLRDLAAEIHTASDGLEALEVISKHTIHCIVCDINMPKMNGVQFIQKLREQNNDVPLIFYTGHGNLTLMREAAKYGAFDFLDKPNLDGLEDVVKSGLAKGLKLTESPASDSEFESEYKRLLKSLDD